MDRNEVLERLDAAGADRGPIEYELVHVSLLRAAAEVLELVAWAEESGIRVARGPLCWITKIGDAYISAPTLIDTLRRAKEGSTP